MKLYVDSSVWSYLFADHVPGKKAATQEFFATKAPSHLLYVSAVVIRELRQTQEALKRQALERAVKRHAPALLEHTPEVQEVSEVILRKRIVSSRSVADSFHLAFSMVHGMDALISWNLHDLVRLKTRRLVAGLCRTRGYKELDIVTPEEV